MFLLSIEPHSKHTHTHTPGCFRKENCMERGKKRWKCFSCLGQSLPGDQYLRFPSMKYSVSASRSSCEWQRLALRGTSLCLPGPGPGLSMPLLSWGGSVTVSLPCAPLFLCVCLQRSSLVSVLPHVRLPPCHHRPCPEGEDSPLAEHPRDMDLRASLWLRPPERHVPERGESSGLWEPDALCRRAGPTGVPRG